MKAITALITILVMIHASAFGAEDEDKFSAEFQNVSKEYSRSRILEFWGYHDYHGNQNYADTLKLRYYQPLDIGSFQANQKS